MRIAYLVSLYPATSHTFIRREIAWLRAQGLEIDSFSIRTPQGADAQTPAHAEEIRQTFYVVASLATAGLPAHLWALSSRPLAYARTLRLALKHRVPGSRALLWSLFHFAESIVFAREVHRRGIRRIHNHFANSAATVGLLAAKFLDVPWSLTLHGISETDYPAGLLLAAKVEAAEFVACVSWFGRAQAMRITAPRLWTKFAIVRCGIARDQLPARSQAPLDSKAPRRIICVGRLSPEKGQSGLIEAFAQVRQRGLSATLHLVGDGPDGAALRAQVAALGLGADVIFAGRLDEGDTLRAIANADLLVSSSLMEGLPVVLMEAMALGVCVVASRVAGVPELIEDGRNGHLFTPAKWSELAEKMVLALTDDDQRAAMTAHGRIRIDQEFAIEKAAAPLIGLFGVRPPADPHQL